MERYEIEGSPEALDELRPTLKAAYTELEGLRLLGLEGGALSAEFDDLPEVAGQPSEVIRGSRCQQVAELIRGACEGTDLDASCFVVKPPDFWVG